LKTQQLHYHKRLGFQDKDVKAARQRLRPQKKRKTVTLNIKVFEDEQEAVINHIKKWNKK
jgi:collagenase-like PrtC family protease